MRSWSAWRAIRFPSGSRGTRLGFPGRDRALRSASSGLGMLGASVAELIGPAMIALVPAVGYFGGVVPGGRRLRSFSVEPDPAGDHGGGRCGSASPSQRSCAAGSARSPTSLWLPARGPGVEVQPRLRRGVRGLRRPARSGAPRYYVDVFGIPLAQAALLTTLFIFPASPPRPLGGWFSDKFGARRADVLGVREHDDLPPAPRGPERSHRPLHAEQCRPERDDQHPAVLGHESVAVPRVSVSWRAAGWGSGKRLSIEIHPGILSEGCRRCGRACRAPRRTGRFLPAASSPTAWAGTGVPQTTFAILFLNITSASFLWLHWVVIHMLHAATPHLEHKFEQQNKNLMKTYHALALAAALAVGALHSTQNPRSPAGGRWMCHRQLRSVPATLARNHGIIFSGNWKGTYGAVAGGGLSRQGAFDEEIHPRPQARLREAGRHPRAFTVGSMRYRDGDIQHSHHRRRQPGLQPKQLPGRQTVEVPAGLSDLGVPRPVFPSRT